MNFNKISGKNSYSLKNEKNFKLEKLLDVNDSMKAEIHE